MTWTVTFDSPRELIRPPSATAPNLTDAILQLLHNLEQENEADRKKYTAASETRARAAQHVRDYLRSSGGD